MRNTYTNTQQKGFFELIIIVLIALILLRFLGINIESVLAQAWVKEFFVYVKDMLILVWQDLMKIVMAVKG